MCGIVGFIDGIKNKQETLKDMMNTIIHRGPDSEGLYFDEGAALGFRRLSIIDVSASGDQPLYNEDRSKVLVFNGEIFNYKELRKELLEAGHIFESNTDSETLLHGYEEWGESLVDRLRGMYAFVIWDSTTKKLFGARDIFGIKPFYYALMNGSLIFASEIKALLEHPGFVKEFNEDALAKYLAFQFVPTNETFFKGVYCLQPGHYFTYADGTMHIQRFFEPDFRGDSTKSIEEMAEQIEQTMKESVEKHMISDVEVASYLSSGVDSSYITYLAKVDRTFTVGFDEQKYSEIQDARQFAKSIHMKNDSKVIKPEEYWEKLSDIQYYMDEPVADPAAIALFFLSEEARKKVKVVLSGEGSDELFGGYNIYCEPLTCTGYEKITLPLRRVVGKAAEYLLPRKLKGRAFLMRRGQTLEERYIGNSHNFTDHEVKKLVGAKPFCAAFTAPLYERVKGKDSVSKMQYVDLHTWLVHDILMKADKLGMANSIEVRVPFLDKEVMKLAETIPLEHKVAPPVTKKALRLAADKVIQSKTADKKKLGFPIPIRVWLREEKYYAIVKERFSSPTAQKYFNQKYLHRLLEEHKEGRFDNSRKIWPVYIFLVWYQRFFEVEKPVHPAISNVK
ncbi:MAG: asparagine synthase (glutamine-hydrolyzing) [Lachnospiraceae bacterium]